MRAPAGPRPRGPPPAQRTQPPARATAPPRRMRGPPGARSDAPSIPHAVTPATAPAVVRVDLGARSYPISIGAGVLDDLASYAGHVGKRALIVTNDVVGPLYLERVTAALKSAGVAVDSVTLPDGEAHKDLATLNLIFDAALAGRHGRDTTLVALGGGVVGDMAGFAAAAYQRGVPFVQVPTTLMAAVDSSVGGKTGVNHPAGKNMIGAFHQPNAVICDVAALDTLPDRELASGLSEVVKYGLIRDAPLFD